MSLIDTTRIERKAVIAVEQLFLDHSKTIEPQVATGDTEISFDGKAILFSNDEITKESYLSSIPVQVKGTEVEKFSDKTAKFYKFDKQTFKNFQLEDGVVVFLVEILKSNQRKTKVYFKFLDTNILEEIIFFLDNNNQEYKVIELNEFTDEMNLDEEFYNIAIQRKVHSYTTTKVDAFLKHDSSVTYFSSDYEEKIIVNAAKSMEQYEYKNPNSQFNLQLKKDMENILSQNIIVDGLGLTTAFAKIETLNLIDILPEYSKNLAYLIKARYHAKIGEYSLAREVCEKVNNSYSINREYYKVWIEANYDNENFLSLLDNDILSNLEKDKYHAAYKLQNNNLTDFHKMFLRRKTDDNEWQYLLAYYFLRLNRFPEAAEILQDINKSLAFTELKIDELNARSTNIANDIFFGFQDITQDLVNNLLKILDELENEREKLNNYDYISFPILEKMSFELKTMLNPRDELKYIEELLTENKHGYDFNYLLNSKIKALFLLGEYNEALKFIDDFLDEKNSEELLMFKVLINIRKENFKGILEFISNFFESNDGIKSNHFYGFLTETYINVVCNYIDIDNNTFESTIAKISKIYTFDLPLLISLEHARNKIGSTKYGESFDKIVKEFPAYPDSRKLEYIKYFLIHNNEVEFAKIIYSEISKTDQLLANEILAYLYLTNNMIEEALAITQEYENSDLSEKLLIIKANSLNMLGQYRATLKLFEDTRNLSNVFLNHILVAKLITQHKEDIGLITDKAISSNDKTFKTNAAVALINFGINLPKGVQILEKYILENNFNDSQLNLAYLGAHLNNAKRLEDNNLIDLYSNVNLKWYKFKGETEVIEFILVPEGWNVKNEKNRYYYDTDSDFKLLVQDVAIGDTIDFKKNEYKLLEEKSLSTFVFQEAMRRESGENGSDKPFIAISIRNEDNGLRNLIDVLKTFDDTEKYNQINQYYNKFHAPFFYDKLIPERDMFEFYLQIFNDVNQKYYVGAEIDFNENMKYQISLSSIATLAALNILDILQYYPEVYIERTQKIWLENLFSEEIESTSPGRINVIDDKLTLNKKTEEQKKELNNLYRDVVISSRKLNENTIDLINQDVIRILSFDESSIQAAINESSVLLCEDEALQIILSNDFGITSASVGSLISHYYLNIENDIDSYLDILNRVIALNSAWKIQEGNLTKISTIVWNSENITLKEKFITWLKNYVTYFNK